MKILVPTDNIKNLENPYLYEIFNNMKMLDGNIVIKDSLNSFWNDDAFNFDIIHIMWPHGILNGHSSEELKKRLNYLKKLNIKIVVTCHNLIPHYNNNKDEVDSYNICYSLSDQIYHLGNYSLELYKKQYPNSSQLLLPHPVYNDKYLIIPTKEEALLKLKLTSKYKYVLCFGRVRAKEEIDLIKYCAKKLKEKNIKFLVPSLQPKDFGVHSKYFIKNFVKKALLIAYFLLNKIKYPSNILFNLVPNVSDDDLPYYFAAADIGFLQRCKILNSGNLPLNYYFEKVTVGPNIGNVGEILTATKNPSFNPENFETAVSAIEKALELQTQFKGKENGILARQNWAIKEIANLQLKYYYNL